MHIWSCSKCKTHEASLRYNSGKMKLCKDCQKYQNMKANCSVGRKRTKPPELSITESDFKSWLQLTPRNCHYCGIQEIDLRSVSIKSSIGLHVESLGIDRLDNTLDYQLGNIVLCCYACNKVKSNFFTQSEMLRIGKSIAEIWRSRRFES
jgi:hypothetical protein